MSRKPPRGGDFGLVPRLLAARQLAVRLIFCGFGAALLGAVAHVLARESAGSEELGPSLASYAARALPEGPWRVLGLTVVLVALFSALAGLLSSLLVRRARRLDRTLEDLSTSGLRQALDEVRLRAEATLAGDEPDVRLGFDELLQGALRVQASDVHMSPTAGKFSVTYRVQGTLYDVAELSPEVGQRIAVRVKVLSRMNTYSREPQDGRLRHQVGEFPLEARVSVLPADYGERIVLRLVRGTLRVPELAQLGFPPEVDDALRAILAKSQGMLFVSGPVGSGKTTTLYSSLQHIATSRGNMTNLVTLEDPIELELSFATQTQINARMGMSFAQTLRSVLRQDPNVLMLGEVRDRETAEIATQAGLTGHLILTTIHVDSAAGTFARLVDMGVEPFVCASAAAGCLSQRLVRVLCTHCRRPEVPEPLVVERFAKLGIELGMATYFGPVGCEYCEGKGYEGRQPIAELLVVSPALRQAIHQRLPTTDLHRLAVSEGMTPLVEAALGRAREGVTSLAEVLRVAG